MPISLRVERGEMGKFSFQSYLIFMSFFFIYIPIFCIPEYLTLMYLLCTDVGLVHPTDFSRTRRHPRPKVGLAGATRPATTTAGGPPAREAERVLRQVERNLTVLTRTVPMAEIENLPPSMQPHVVAVPRTWVQLFRHLANIVVHYGKANRPRP
jgi:hypothetical protein